ncbi:MAG TPA: alpha-L-rhamnosidase C-terminal domain-containing protein [Capsulimonadaceae bacterium]|jgi:hypothetical protein
MRVLIDYIPFDAVAEAWMGAPAWPASWIRHPEAVGAAPFVGAYRLSFTIREPKTVRFHVTADERYELFLDGVRIGRGSERGDHANWYFESYDVPFTSGAHTLVARCWWLGDHAPGAQITYRPGFLMAAENEPQDVFNTGHAPWVAAKINGYQFTPCGEAFGTGSKLDVDGSQLTWGVESGEGDDWRSVEVIQPARNQYNNNGAMNVWRLAPATLPPMVDIAFQTGIVRHVEVLKSTPEQVVDLSSTPVVAANCDPGRLPAWQSLVTGLGHVVIEPYTTLRAIVDLGDYYCAYPELELTGGDGADVRIDWAEALYLLDAHDKGHRDEIEGKRFFSDGVGDRFRHDGNDHRRYTTLWWQAGRYIQFTVTTGKAALTIDTFLLRETRYPLPITAEFDCSDTRINSLVPLATRALEMCAHETYMDCPYYEQLMYVGDTRLEVLTTYALSTDDRLPRKALSLFNSSRDTRGFTASSYPCRNRQVIPPFSLWWVAMVHDYAMWRDDLAFVRTLLPGVRAVIDAFLGYVNADGLVERPSDWNFVDWVPAWRYGVPPDADSGVSGVLNWHLVYSLELASQLEAIAGYPELAARNSRLANEISAATTAAFFDGPRGLMADDIMHSKWSEHSQCLALLSGSLPENVRATIAASLPHASGLEKTTIYFSHYLFETYRTIARPDLLMDRLDLWLNLVDRGFKTTVEAPEPSRSDCHAWGAHPLFHFHASIVGIRPAAPGFREISITPQLGSVQHVRSTFPHPLGPVHIEITKTADEISGAVSLPVGLPGVLNLGTKAIHLDSGRLTAFAEHL